MPTTKSGETAITPIETIAREIDMEPGCGGELVVQFVLDGAHVLFETVSAAEDGEPVDSAAVYLTLDEARELHLRLTALLLRAQT